MCVFFLSFYSRSFYAKQPVIAEFSLHPPRRVRSAEPGPHCPADLQSCHDHTATYHLGLSVPFSSVSLCFTPGCLSSVRLYMDSGGPETCQGSLPTQAAAAECLEVVLGRREEGSPPARTQCFPGGWNHGCSVSMSGLEGE